jgi:hypothetical protein
MLRADKADPDDLLPACLPVALETWDWLVVVAAADEDRSEHAAGAAADDPSCGLLPFPVLILFLKRPKQPISPEQQLGFSSRCISPCASTSTTARSTRRKGATFGERRRAQWPRLYTQQKTTNTESIQLTQNSLTIERTPSYTFSRGTGNSSTFLRQHNAKKKMCLELRALVSGEIFFFIALFYSYFKTRINMYIITDLGHCYIRRIRLVHIESAGFD